MSPLSLGELGSGLRLARRLPWFLRQRVDSIAAQAVVTARLAQREALLLAQVRDAILPFANHPTARLLRHAGVAAADLATLIEADGAEGALRQLFHAGVFLTHEELKGRAEVVRGSLRFQVEPSQLQNRRIEKQLSISSSGSTGRATQTPLDLDSLLESCANSRLAHDAWGARTCRSALWTIPGSTGVMNCLRLIAIGESPAEQWFSLVDPDTSEFTAGIRFGPRLVAFACRAAGYRLPSPQHAPLRDPSVVIAWLRQVLSDGSTPYLSTSPSAAVRLCEAAQAASIDLSGAHLIVRGEPLTATRRAIVEAAGMTAHAIYGSAEVNLVAYGCLASKRADDMHVMTDLHAMIQAEGEGSLPPGALLLTPLAPRASTIALNLSLGDFGTVTDEPCDCPLERYGWKVRLHSVISFEKLTGAGMTFADADVIRILEQVLPARFGGSPLSYQLLESEEAGRAVLTLAIDPALGDIDTKAVRATFLEAIANLGAIQRVMSHVWRDADLLRIERTQPHVTKGGKVLHFHSAHTTAP